MGYKINFLREIFWLEEHKNGLTYKSDAYRKLIWLRPILSEVEVTSTSSTILLILALYLIIPQNNAQNEAESFASTPSGHDLLFIHVFMASKGEW